MAWRGRGAGVARVGVGGGLGCVGASAVHAQLVVWMGVRGGKFGICPN